MSEDLVAIARLSPAPSASDYDAICAALMQTERGRWFLQEYALRNRSADTKLLLSAIERIEDAVCSERSRQVQHSFRTDLREMASAITRTRAEVAGLKSGAGSATIPATPGHQPPGDVFAAAERIRDVTWAMRGHGFDPSTCQQLEELAATILSASALRDPTDHRASKLSEVLQYLERRITTLLDSCAEAEASTERDRAPAREAAVPLPAVAATEVHEVHDGTAIVLAMPTVDHSADATESQQVTSFLAALHDDLDDTADPPSPAAAIVPMKATVAAVDAPAVDATSLLAGTPEVSDQEAAQPPLEAAIGPAAPEAAPIVAEAVVVAGDRLPEAVSNAAGDLAPREDSLPARLMAIVASTPAEAAPMRPAPFDPDPPDGEQAGLSLQPIGNDPLGALKAMSEHELIALFS